MAISALQECQYQKIAVRLGRGCSLLANQTVIGSTLMLLPLTLLAAATTGHLLWSVTVALPQVRCNSCCPPEARPA